MLLWELAEWKIPPSDSGGNFPESAGKSLGFVAPWLAVM